MTLRVLYKPLWVWILALLGLILLLLLIVDGLLSLIFFLFTIPVPVQELFMFTIITHPILTVILCYYLYHRFVKVTPSASFAYEWNDGPWLSWRSDPRTSIVINWITNTVTESKVLFGTDSHPDSMKTIEGKPEQSHHLEITGLQPSSRYYYQIIDTLVMKTKLDSPSLHAIHSFWTAPADGKKEFSFVVLGDTQNGGGFSKPDWALYPILNHLKTTNFDLLMHVGDFEDQGNDIKSWHSTLSTMAEIASKIPMHVAVGNHDTGTHYMHDPEIKKYPDDGANFDYIFQYNYERPADEHRITSFQTRYYSIDYLNCRFLFLDTQNQRMGDERSSQLDFVRSKFSNCNDKWKIVLIHWPIMEWKRHKDGNFYYKYTPHGKNLFKLFNESGVGLDLLISGHAHNYKLYYCKRGIQDIENPEADAFPDHAIKKETGSGTEIIKNAEIIPYVVSGGAGEALKKTDAITKFDITPKCIQYDEDSSQYLHVFVSENKLRVESHYPNGEIMHHFEIHK